MVIILSLKSNCLHPTDFIFSVNYEHLYVYIVVISMKVQPNLFTMYISELYKLFPLIICVLLNVLVETNIM